MSVEMQINEFNTNQFDQLKLLFGTYFKADDKLLTEIYTNWLYAKNPYGLARIVTAVVENRWVGFMALIPVKLLRRDSSVVAYYVVNVLVHPDFQGKHLFGRMIKEAKEFVCTQNAVLMGHPNKLALPMWKRARMHFHETLMPYLTVPKLRIKGICSRDMVTPSQMQLVLQALNEQSLEADSWQLAVTDEYLRWRYIDHPTNSYRIQLIEADKVIVGIQLSKKIRLGINLLLDQFVLDSYANASLGCLPWLTIAFKPKSVINNLSGSFFSLPIKKNIPFFFSHYQQIYTDSDVMHLGLSVSDF